MEKESLFANLEELPDFDKETEVMKFIGSKLLLAIMPLT